VPRGATIIETDENPHQVRSDVIYSELREVIVSGRLAPGARLVEVEVARRLGMSRTPVRAALHRLQQERYVVPAGMGSARTRLVVAPLTADDASDLFNIIARLEGLASRYAAGLGRNPRTRLAEELERLNSELLDASRTARPELHLGFELDAEFHLRVVEAAAPPRLLALNDAIKPQADRYTRLYASAVMDDLSVSVAEHSEIIRCIGDGDVDGAQRSMETNWMNAAARLALVVESMGERGVW
jgi:DNA-binding GntR family transcriptional regulator